MSDRGKPLTSEQAFKKLIWRSSLSVSEPMERFTTWTLTGVAATTALIVSNLDAIERLVTATGMQATIVLFGLSLLSGVASKQFGMALSAGLKMINDMEQFLYSEQGAALMDSMEAEPEALIGNIADPYPWPLSFLMRRSGLRGLDDYLATDKLYIRLFSVQLALNLAHVVLGVAGVLTLGWYVA